MYEILKIVAPSAEIRASYLKLAREYPDRVPEYLTKLRADAEDEIKDINYALGKWQPEWRFPRFDLHWLLRTHSHSVPLQFRPTVQ